MLRRRGCGVARVGCSECRADDPEGTDHQSGRRVLKPETRDTLLLSRGRCPVDPGEDGVALSLPYVSLGSEVTIGEGGPPMASASSSTLAKLPSRMASPTRSRKKRSTKFIHELEVGVKCCTMRS